AVLRHERQSDVERRSVERKWRHEWQRGIENRGKEDEGKAGKTCWRRRVTGGGFARSCKRKEIGCAMKVRFLGCVTIALIMIPAALARQQTVESKKVLLAEGTEVALKMAQDVSSRGTKPGEPVELKLAEDLKVGDVTVAKAGARALGEVIRAKRP